MGLPCQRQALDAKTWPERKTCQIGGKHYEPLVPREKYIQSWVETKISWHHLPPLRKEPGRLSLAWWTISLGTENQIITWKKLINCLFKINFFFILFDKFPENLGDVSDEQGERFPLDIKVMEERYQGGWGIHIMADYC